MVAPPSGLAAGARAAGTTSALDGGIGDPVALSALILLSGIASVALAVVGVMAFRRRRSPSYLLVATALIVLAVKAFVGGLTVAGLMEVRLHHLVEHGLDFLTALLLIGAIYAARSRHRCRVTTDSSVNR
ncbi:MAG: hypothetical protein ABEJ77_00405 [Halanaeroarchaeum sp.]